jgi:hypothetical protein
MLDNENLPSPFVVSVLENYYNERPENNLIDLTALPVDHGYRRAVVDALNGNSCCKVSYETLQSSNGVGYIESKSGVTIMGSVTLVEDGSGEEYDGYTIPEDWEWDEIEENLAAWHAERENPTLTERDKQWIAQMHHSGVAFDVIMSRFSITREQIVSIAKEITPEDLERHRQEVLKSQDDLMGGLRSILG